jgi:hypothetical protein
MTTSPEEARILDALALRKYSSHDLQAVTGLRAAAFYPTVRRPHDPNPPRAAWR